MATRLNPPNYNQEVLNPNNLFSSYWYIYLQGLYKSVEETVNAETITRETFSPAAAQTVFTLSNSPTGSQIFNSLLYLNGQKLIYPLCYTISGSQLTLTLPYSLATNDIIEIYY